VSGSLVEAEETEQLDEPTHISEELGTGEPAPEDESR
jgi:hypothetical protein